MSLFLEYISLSIDAELQMVSLISDSRMHPSQTSVVSGASPEGVLQTLTGEGGRMNYPFVRVEEAVKKMSSAPGAVGPLTFLTSTALGPPWTGSGMRYC